jgi:hypothetical protein
VPDDEYAQIAKIDEPFLSWKFDLLDASSTPLANVSKQFRGFGREVSDTAIHSFE